MRRRKEKETKMSHPNEHPKVGERRKLTLKLPGVTQERPPPD